MVCLLVVQARNKLYLGTIILLVRNENWHQVNLYVTKENKIFQKRKKSIPMSVISVSFRDMALAFSILRVHSM